MSSSDDEGGAGGARTIRDVPVDWEALEDAFENNAPEVHSYLHLGTGEVLRVVDGIADPDMHTRIAADSNYLTVDPVSSREQYRWMERFIQMLDDPDLRERLTAAIDGKGAFRRFKDVLMSYGTERERWFAFRSERLRVFMEAWLSAHALTAVARPVWTAQPSETVEEVSAPPEPEATPAARRVRTSETLRRQLSEVAEGLGARDLEKVLAFAEFVRARRAARGFGSRTEAAGATASEEPASEPEPVTDGPPSSRRRSAAK
jgi:hypothetical protein